MAHRSCWQQLQLGRITGVTDSKGRSLTCRYNALGQRTGMTTPEGRVVGYSYDATNRLGNITADSRTFTFSYNVLDRAGIEYFRFHDLRHTFATRLAQAGVDLYKIAKLLGHKDVKMTQRYSHHCPESLRDGVEALDKCTTVLQQSKEKGATLNA